MLGILAATTYQTGASTGDTIRGVVLAFAIGALPTYALFSSGARWPRAGWCSGSRASW